MSATGVNLHLRRKNVLLYVLGYVLIILLLTAAVAVPTIDNLAQLQAGLLTLRVRVIRMVSS